MLTTDGSSWASTSAVPWGPRAMMSRPRMPGEKASSRTRPSSSRSILGEPGGLGTGGRAGRGPPSSGGAVPYGSPTGIPKGTGWGGRGSVGSATKLLADVGNSSVPHAT
jgi:hypothetical protein